MRYLVFSTGLAFSLAAVSLLMASHHAPLSGNASAAERLDRWRMTHVLVAECPCSEALSTYLVRRGPQDTLIEQVVVVGTGAVAEQFSQVLDSAGYGVRVVGPRELRERVGIAGGPWLIIHDDAGTVRYSGGYASVRPADSVGDDQYQDRLILARLRSGLDVRPLDALGCSVNPGFSDLLKPLN